MPRLQKKYKDANSTTQFNNSIIADKSATAIRAQAARKAGTIPGFEAKLHKNRGEDSND